MATTDHKNIDQLHLDLANFRTVHQPNEKHAVAAFISIEPNRFWGLMESLLEEGFSATDNIIVIKSPKGLIVKEGNRRVGALKVILKLIKGIDVPDDIQKKIDGLAKDWKKENATVPCVIYEADESEKVDRLVSRTHAKGEKAARSDWNAVARARFGRDRNNDSEPGLDLLEKYLKHGKNLSQEQAERWAGVYPLTVLDEAAQKLTKHLELGTTVDFVRLYPGKHKKLVENILFDIGCGNLGFQQIRGEPFWGISYGLAPKTPPPTTGQPGNGSASSSGGGDSPPNSQPAPAPPPKKQKALAAKDPKSVRRALRQFTVLGSGREKVVDLLNEIKSLRHEDHPHAFCFLLRSLFELSAKAYCDDHAATGGPSLHDNKGNDKKLVVLLREIVNHVTQNGADRVKTKLLHGPTSELAQQEGLLSVTSLNQLVHNPSFSVTPSDISILFHRVFPLLQEMNS